MDCACWALEQFLTWRKMLRDVCCVALKAKNGENLGQEVPRETAETFPLIVISPVSFRVCKAGRYQ